MALDEKDNEELLDDVIETDSDLLVLNDKLPLVETDAVGVVESSSVNVDDGDRDKDIETEGVADVVELRMAVQDRECVTLTVGLNVTVVLVECDSVRDPPTVAEDERE